LAKPHEVYPNAPAALVAVEVRFPESDTPKSVPMTLQRAFRDLLGEGWVIESMKTRTMELSIGPGGAMQQPSQVVTVPRFTVRDRTLAVAVTADTLVVETTNYVDYVEFRAVLAHAFDATHEVFRPDGISRVGMRYIDEIRVPGVNEENLVDWAKWLDPSLMPPKFVELTDAGFKMRAWEGILHSETGSDQSLVLRYGPRNGYAVNPDGPLKRLSPPAPGPLFALDFDSFWLPSDIPEFEPETLMDVCDRLKDPVRTLFDALMTDELLTEFRKEVRGGR